MQTYNELGKARKTCQCGTIIHARTLECPNCHYEFGKKKNIVSAPTIFTEGGKGKKLCPNCNKYAGAKSKVCPNCQVEFIKKEAKEIDIDDILDDIANLEEEKPVKKLDRDIVASYTGSLIYTPSGECPFKIKDETQEGVIDWCRKIYQYGLDNNKTYTKNAIEYWFRVEDNNQELKGFINDFCSKEGYESHFATDSKHEEYPEGESATLQLLSL